MSTLLYIAGGICLVAIGYILGGTMAAIKIIANFLAGEFQVDKKNNLNLLSFEKTQNDVLKKEYVLLKVVEKDLSDKQFFA